MLLFIKELGLRLYVMLNIYKTIPNIALKKNHSIFISILLISMVLTPKVCLWINLNVFNSYIILFSFNAFTLFYYFTSKFYVVNIHNNYYKFVTKEFVSDRKKSCNTNYILNRDNKIISTWHIFDATLYLFCFLASIYAFNKIYLIE